MFALQEIDQMEQVMCSYLEWQLNVNPSTLRDFQHHVPIRFRAPLATAPPLQPETATALTRGEWLLPLACSHVLSPLPLTAQIVAIKVASSQAS